MTEKEKRKMLEALNRVKKFSTGEQDQLTSRAAELMLQDRRLTADQAIFQAVDEYEAGR